MFARLGKQMSAWSMNIGKGILALIVMGLILLPSGISLGNTQTILLLAISGILGITFGDTLYFMTLTRLGSRLTLLLGSLIPVTTAIIAAVFLGESISLLSWIGVGLTISGVTYVLWERSDDVQMSTHWKQGVGIGLVFVLANSLSIIFSKLGVEDIPSMDATFMRQVWAMAGFGFIGFLSGNMLTWVKPLTNPLLLKPLLIAAFIGAFLGTWLSIYALKYTYVTVATVLNSTSPLFILPLAVWVLKEHVSIRAIVGACVALAGIALYFGSLSL